MTIKVFSKVSKAFVLGNVKEIKEVGCYYEFYLDDDYDPLTMYVNWVFRIEILK